MVGKGVSPETFTRYELNDGERMDYVLSTVDPHGAKKSYRIATVVQEGITFVFTGEDQVVRRAVDEEFPSTAVPEEVIPHLLRQAHQG